MSPIFFSLGFSVGEVSKIEVTFVAFCVKSISYLMLHIAKLILIQSLVW